MLLVSRIQEEKQQIAEALKKRNFPEPEKALDKILEADTLRRNTQTELDAVLAESNAISKQIGCTICLMCRIKKSRTEILKQIT